MSTLSPPRRILFCCPPSLLDTSNGAAISARSLLAGLAARGYEVVALQAAIFDSPQGGEQLGKALSQHKDSPVFRTRLDEVEHLIIRTAHWERKRMTCEEEERLYAVFRHELAQRRPDLIMLWGSLLLERAIMREARDAGIPVAFYLVNPGYLDASVFKDVSLALTDSEATASLYRQRFKLDVRVIGKFIRKQTVVAKSLAEPSCITFINPSFEKGVSVFLALALLAAREAPEIRFMVVQGRGNWARALDHFKLSANDLPNVHVLPNQADMRPVYARTRVLLLPSLWHESGSRVIIEALLNDIPVLASDTGGSRELVGCGGMVFPVSEAVREHPMQMVMTEAELRPWLIEIQRLWHDPAHYQVMQRQARLAASEHDLESNLDRAAKLLDIVLTPGHSMPTP